MRLIGGMTIEQLMDNCRPRGEINSKNYSHWVTQIMESEREELHQWHILNMYSGRVDLPKAALNEMYQMESAKAYKDLAEWLLDMQYPVLWNTAAFGFKQIDTYLELLPVVKNITGDEKNKRFLLWTLIHVWQISCRNMIMGHESQAGWADARRAGYMQGVDRIIAVIGREAYERFFFSFECYWPNPHIDKFYLMICDYLASSFSSQAYIKDFCEMNYLYHVANRCNMTFWGNKKLTQQLIGNLKEAFGRLSLQGGTTWKSLFELVYSTIVPIYIRAYDDTNATIAQDIDEIVVKREGWKVNKDVKTQGERTTREASWLGLLVWVAIDTASEELYHKLVDTIFAQYHVSDKEPESFNFGLRGLIDIVYEKIVIHHPDWIEYMDMKILQEFDNFIDVAVMLSRHNSYDAGVKDAVKARWAMEKDVVKVKVKDGDLWKQIERWMKSVEAK